METQTDFTPDWSPIAGGFPADFFKFLDEPGGDSSDVKPEFSPLDTSTGSRFFPDDLVASLSGLSTEEVVDKIAGEIIGAKRCGEMSPEVARALACRLLEWAEGQEVCSVGLKQDIKPSVDELSDLDKKILVCVEEILGQCEFFGLSELEGEIEKRYNYGNQLLVGLKRRNQTLEKFLSRFPCEFNLSGSRSHLTVSLLSRGSLDPISPAATNTLRVKVARVPTEEQLREIFKDYGDIHSIRVVAERHYAYVNFRTIRAAKKALEGLRPITAITGLKVSFHSNDRSLKSSRATKGVKYKKRVRVKK